MQSIFSVACLLALLQTAVSTPVLAPRVDVVAHAGKGQSDSKCYGMLTGFCGGAWGMGYPYLGGGLFKKDASDAQQNAHDNSA
ncbi:hypothetical protein PtB15_14B365 [Puccinia triticina]|nr:hypothetical protein PtB15_14B365 [Puccinia triticina]